MEKAKTDCAAGVEANRVKETLNTALKTAKEKLQADRKNLATKSTAEALVKTRNEAVRAAHEAFKTTLKSEIEKLKAALAAASTSSTEDEGESEGN